MGVNSDVTLGTVLSVSLTADNQAVTTTGASLLLVTSDNTTATNRTFTLGAGLAGQTLNLVLVSGSSTTCELADTGIQKLSAAWTPLQYDSIALVCDGTNWIELARADN